MLLPSDRLAASILPIYANAVEAMLNPQIVRLSQSHYGVKFPLIKLLPARNIIRKAIEGGKLHRGDHVIDTSSGTFALALAMVGKLEGLKVTVICDPAMDDNLKKRIGQVGGEVVLVDTPLQIGGYQGARMLKLTELLQEYPNARWSRQYHNPNNRLAFEPLADLLLAAFGDIHCIVGAVGSGGTMSGLSGFLRRSLPDLHVIAIDSYGSVLFGQDDLPRSLRGAGSSILFDNLLHENFDDVHWMTGQEAFHAARQLYWSDCLYVGATSAASAIVGRWWSNQNPDKIVLSIMPDEGYRYQQMFYNDEWLALNKIPLAPAPNEPVTVSHPKLAQPSWSRFVWKRQTYEQALGCEKPRYQIDPILSAL